MEKLDKEQEIIKILFKDFLADYNSRSISKIVRISHAGAFKILKRLESEEIVVSKRIGNAAVYSLNLENPLAKKTVEMILIIESQNNKRWLEEFKDIKAKIIILFGSVIHNEKEARDIDLLVIADKKNFKNIKKAITDKNKLTAKKIHMILQTEKEFKKDLLKRNKVIIEIIKKGIVLIGQDKMVDVLK